MPVITSCKDCFGTRYQKDRCAYERAKDYADTFAFYKEKYGEEFPDLLIKAQALAPATTTCKAERNAAMPILMQQEMMDQLNANVRQLNETVNSLLGKSGMKASAKASENQATSGKMKVWRPDIKKEKLQEAIGLLKAKYPTLTDGDIEAIPNKNGNLTIKYKAQ